MELAGAYQHLQACMMTAMRHKLGLSVSLEPCLKHAQIITCKSAGAHLIVDLPLFLIFEDVVCLIDLLELCGVSSCVGAHTAELSANSLFGHTDNVRQCTKACCLSGMSTMLSYNPDTGVLV